MSAESVLLEVNERTLLEISPRLVSICLAFLVDHPILDGYIDAELVTVLLWHVAGNRTDDNRMPLLTPLETIHSEYLTIDELGAAFSAYTRNKDFAHFGEVFDQWYLAHRESTKTNTELDNEWIATGYQVTGEVKYAQIMYVTLEGDSTEYITFSSHLLEVAQTFLGKTARATITYTHRNAIINVTSHRKLWWEC